MRPRVEDGADGGERAADLGGLPDDEQVAGQGQAEPEAEGGALHRRHRGAAQADEPGHHRVEALHDRFGVLRQRLGVAQVAPGAEPLALAPQQQRPGRVLLQLVEGAAQRRHRRLVEGVAPLGPVEDELGDVAVALQQDGIAHPFFSSRVATIVRTS